MLEHLYGVRTSLLMQYHRLRRLQTRAWAPRTLAVISCALGMASKEVTVTYSTNVTSDPNQILALEYRVSDRLSFIAQYEQASTRRLSSHNNNFNFEIRFRKRF